MITTVGFVLTCLLIFYIGYKTVRIEKDMDLKKKKNVIGQRKVSSGDEISE